MEEGMVRIERRFFFKDVDAGTGDFTAVEASAKSWETTTGPRASLIRKAVGFI